MNMNNTSGIQQKQNWRYPNTTKGTESGIFCGQCGAKMYMDDDGWWHCLYCTDGHYQGDYY